MPAWRDGAAGGQLQVKMVKVLETRLFEREIWKVKSEMFKSSP